MLNCLPAAPRISRFAIPLIILLKLVQAKCTAADGFVLILGPTRGKSISATAVLTAAATALITSTATAVLAGTAHAVLQPMWVNPIRRVDVSDVLGIFDVCGFIVCIR